MSQTDWTPPNLAAMWRDWIVKSEQQWSEAASKLLKDERAGGLLNKQVNEARMMHKQFSEMAQMSLAAANLPSHSDIEGLDERLGRVEDGLAAIGAALVQLREALVKREVAKDLTPRPPRNRKPAPTLSPRASTPASTRASAKASSKASSKAPSKG